MKVIEIELDENGLPRAFPTTQSCLSGETLVFVVSSENSLITDVNLAFDDTSADVFYCPDGNGARQYHCKLGLHATKDPDYPKAAAIWGLAIEHKDLEPKVLKYSITPFVGSTMLDALDPWIVITKRP